jgi:hypothetical protein
MLWDGEGQKLTLAPLLFAPVPLPDPPARTAAHSTVITRTHAPKPSTGLAPHPRSTTRRPLPHIHPYPITFIHNLSFSHSPLYLTFNPLTRHHPQWPSSW